MRQNNDQTINYKSLATTVMPKKTKKRQKELDIADCQLTAIRCCIIMTFLESDSSLICETNITIIYVKCYVERVVSIRN